MTVITTRRTRPSGAGTAASEPRTVCLTFGPAADVAHLLRVAAEALEHAGAAATAIEPSTITEGAWLRVTCEVDPAHVATLVALPSLGDHRVDPGLADRRRPRALPRLRAPRLPPRRLTDPAHRCGGRGAHPSALLASRPCAPGRSPTLGEPRDALRPDDVDPPVARARRAPGPGARRRRCRCPT